MWQTDRSAPSTTTVHEFRLVLGRQTFQNYAVSLLLANPCSVCNWHAHQCHLTSNRQTVTIKPLLWGQTHWTVVWSKIPWPILSRGDVFMLSNNSNWVTLILNGKMTSSAFSILLLNLLYYWQHLVFSLMTLAFFFWNSVVTMLRYLLCILYHLILYCIIFRAWTIKHLMLQYSINHWLTDWLNWLCLGFGVLSLGCRHYKLNMKCASVEVRSEDQGT